jgi:hypothetical protein
MYSIIAGAGHLRATFLFFRSPDGGSNFNKTIVLNDNDINSTVGQLLLALSKNSVYVLWETSIPSSSPMLSPNFVNVFTSSKNGGSRFSKTMRLSPFEKPTNSFLFLKVTDLSLLISS